ncbi:MAG: hypothetical protein KA138_00635 [Saprospiraceae bacterium]|nr:hypothetical protein [Saprospiraceae bacterium]
MLKPRLANRSYAQRPMVAFIYSGTMGLEMWSFIPAAGRYWSPRGMSMPR